MQDLNNEEKLEYYKKHFDEKTDITEEKSILDLQELSTMIKQLNSYIDGTLDLSLTRIDFMISHFIKNFTIILIYELKEDIIIQRSRKFEEENLANPYCFDELSKLLYVPEEKKEYILLGRLNQAKEAIYYASIETDATPIDNISLSEINALEMEYINILSSTIKKSLNVMHIGAFDLLVRKQQLPGWVDSFYETAFNILKDNCDKKKLEYLFDSYIICNAFLADVLKRKGNDRLYDVTSSIAKMLLHDKNTDAIVYESVQVKDAPVIAIKTDIVDNHIEHNQVTCFKIKTNLGYGVYYGDQINKAMIVNNENNLKWEK
ncbi:MAG: hypothetical protein GQ570_03015 [Helicobacteraceae bacterium]|nr:hypothetical protein [Helicobacteraceae bacterium]